MALEIKLPALGEGVNSADVASILVKEGDTVTAGQNILELETEKAVVELPSPQAGRIAKILVKAGQTLKPGDAVLSMEGNGAEAKPAAKPAAAPEAKKDAAPAPAAAAPAAKSNDAKPAAGKTGPIEFKIPPLGEGVDKADVANILVKVGDTVSPGQNVFELETEKAVVEVPLKDGGTVTEIHVKAGQTVKVGDKALTLTGSVSAEKPAPSAAPSAAPAASPAKESQPTAPARPGTGEMPSLPNAPQTAPMAAITPNVSSDGSKFPAPAGPSTRRLARKLGVNLHQLKGSGRRGRITREDVEGFVRQVMAGKVSVGGATAGTGVPALPLPDFAQWGPVERKPMNKIAKTAAVNLSYAWQTIPHVTQHELADVTDLENGRKRHQSGKQNVKITMTVLAIKAVVAGLKQYPNFNASLDPATNEIILKNYYHVGVAVDTEHGLVVPVIRDVNHKSILDIARELDSLAARARDRKLAPSDYQGGTFTITNLGGIGGTMFTPIVNWPEVAILGMSRAKQQYQIIDGKPEVRLMLPLSLSYDHRVVNGADAARFITKISGLLADPSQLLIES